MQTLASDLRARLSMGFDPPHPNPLPKRGEGAHRSAGQRAHRDRGGRRRTRRRPGHLLSFHWNVTRVGCLSATAGSGLPPMRSWSSLRAATSPAMDMSISARATKRTFVVTMPSASVASRWSSSTRASRISLSAERDGGGWSAAMVGRHGRLRHVEIPQCARAILRMFHSGKSASTHSASKRAFDAIAREDGRERPDVFDGLWTRVNALMIKSGAGISGTCGRRRRGRAATAVERDFAAIIARCSVGAVHGALITAP